MGKWILLALVAGFGAWWSFHAGRQMDEDAIEAQYNVEAQAIAKLDADYLCDRMTDDFRHEAVTFTLGGTQRETHDKLRSCEELRESFRIFKRLNALTHGAMGMSVDNRIVEVRLSEDRKSAEVEAVALVHLGGRLLSRSHGVDRVIRRNGRILHAESKSRSWVYVPME